MPRSCNRFYSCLRVWLNVTNVIQFNHEIKHTYNAKPNQTNRPSLIKNEAITYYLILKLQNRLIPYKRASRGRILTLAGRENGPFSLTDYLSWHSFSSFLLSALPIFKSSKVHTGKNNKDFIVKFFQIDCCIIQEVQI